MRIAKYSLTLVLILGLAGSMVSAEGAPETCIYCGMYRAHFQHSWVIITYEDNSRVSVCSVHCAAIEMTLHTDKTIQKITVGDFDTKRQIDADRAYWVMGGDLMGVMTARAKWAFETKDRADSFMHAHGGQPADFQDVIKATFEDMYQDILIIRKKRKLINIRKNQPPL